MKKHTMLVLTAIWFFVGLSLKAEKVTVKDRQILVNEIPYTIKGICYNPVDIGSSQRSFDKLSKDLELMKEAGINTIRVYSPIENKEVLDQIDEAGIKIIIGFGYNQGGKNDILSGSFINYVKKYSDHNAILMWELGNEYNYHPQWFDNDIKNWYKAMNDAAILIHKIDKFHPVTTAHGELPNEEALSLCPAIDVWGMNVYRWDNPEEIFTQWKSKSEKPMYLSEAGADSYMVDGLNGYAVGENQKAQADAVKNILDDTFRFTDICSGVAIFAFTDEWWKAGNNDVQDPGGWAPNSSGVPYDGAANEEYWGILDVHRNKKLAFDVVKSYYFRNN